MLLISKTIVMPGKDFTAVSEFEAGIYCRDGKTQPHNYRLDQIKELVEHETDFIFDLAEDKVDSITIYPEDDRLSLTVLQNDGATAEFNFDVTSENKAAAALFVFVLCHAPAYGALHRRYSMDHVFTFSNELTARVILGDKDTYPRYVSRITPRMVDSAEYGTEDAQTIAFDFVYVGDQRTDNSVMADAAIARYIAELEEPEMSNGYGRIYPAVMHGTLIEFNGMVGFPHSLILPRANETTFQMYVDLGMTFKDAITHCDTGNAVWIDTRDGSETRLYN